LGRQTSFGFSAGFEVPTAEAQKNSWAVGELISTVKSVSCVLRESS
jgi:hypothetical protein